MFKFGGGEDEQNEEDETELEGFSYGEKFSFLLWSLSDIPCKHLQILKYYTSVKADPWPHHVIGQNSQRMKITHDNKLREVNQ